MPTMTRRHQKFLIRMVLLVGTAVSLVFVPRVLVFAWIHPIPSTVEKQENLELVLDLSADFEPDQGYAYSNTNYLLLSRIMDKVLGHPHFPFIQGRILDRLNLKHTYASVGAAPFDSIMSGYQSKTKYHPDMGAVIVQFSGPTHPGRYNWNLASITYNRIARIVRRQYRT